jgi:hypothetical protein
MERIGLPHGPILIAVALAFFGHFISMGNAISGGTVASGLLLTLWADAVLAWAGARLFQDTHRMHDLELLLTTPLGGRDMLRGQWLVLRRALLWPVGAALVVALPSAIAILYGFLSGQGGQITYFFLPFLIPLNLLLETVALSWAGMWFGLRSRTLVNAVAWTVGVVQLVPVGVVIALASLAWTLPYIYSYKLRTAGLETPAAIPILLFFAIKNLALIAWARSRLRRELRVAR